MPDLWESHYTSGSPAGGLKLEGPAMRMAMRVVMRVGVAVAMLHLLQLPTPLASPTQRGPGLVRAQRLQRGFQAWNSSLKTRPRLSRCLSNRGQSGPC